MNPVAKRKSLRLLTNGVYVMSARNGTAFGVATVSWVSQASFRPPLVMAAIRKESKVFKCLRESQAAAIHILSREQQALAQRFFTPTKATGATINGEPFFDGVTSAPLLKSLPVYLECLVRRVIDDLGDHAIVIMEVTEAACPVDLHPMTIAESPWEYGG